MPDKDDPPPPDTLDRFRRHMEDIRRAVRDIEAVLSSPEMAAADPVRRSMALAALDTLNWLPDDWVHEIDNTKREILDWLSRPL
jgi:hypothetical protein